MCPQVMLELFAIRVLELVAYLESSNHTTTEGVRFFSFLFVTVRMDEAVHILQCTKRKYVLVKATTNSRHTTPILCEVSIMSGTSKCSN